MARHLHVRVGVSAFCLLHLRVDMLEQVECKVYCYTLYTGRAAQTRAATDSSERTRWAQKIRRGGYSKLAGAEGHLFDATPDGQPFRREPG